MRGPRRGALRRALVLVLAVAGGLAAAPAPPALPAGSGEEVRPCVVIVPSSDARAYALAAAAIRSRLPLDRACSRVTPLDRIAENRALPDGDVYVAIGTSAAVALHARVKPPARLVYCLVTEPEAYGLTRGEPRAGVSADVPARDQFALLGEALPDLRRLGVLHRSSSGRSRRLIERARRELPRGWTLRLHDLDDYKAPAPAILGLLDDDVDAVWTILDGEVFDRAVLTTLLRYSISREIPVFGFSPTVVREGALLGTGIDPETQGRQAAALVLRYLEEAPERAIVVPPEFRLAVNLTIARELDVRLPRSLVEKADDRFGEER